MSDPRGKPGSAPGEQQEHLDEMTCLLYVDRQLDRTRGQEVSAHTQDCEQCRTLLRVLERESRLLTRSLLEEDEPLPSRLAALQQEARRSWQWIYGVVFGLAATGAYALYTGYIEPWQQRFEQAGFGGSNLLGLLIFQGAFWKGWQSMITLIEVMALLTVGFSAAMFFRRRVRRGTALAIMFAAAFASMAMPAPAGATEMRKGDSPTVAKEETIKGDVYITGHHARIEGNVDGDAYVFCQNLDVDGHISGDLIVFAQVVRINGQISGNIRSFTNTLTIAGSVEKNMTSFSEMVALDSKSVVGGSITAFVNTLGVDGRVGRDLLVMMKSTNISGNVGGAITAKGESLVIDSGAQIDGPVKFQGKNPPNVSPSAKLASPVDFSRMEHREEYRRSGFYVWRVIWTAAVILFGLVLFSLLPHFSRETVDSAGHYGASFGLGLLVMFGVPIAALLACVTVVGLLIGLSTFALWMAAMFSAQLVVGAVVGQWLMGRTTELWPLVGRMVVGVCVVRAIGMIPYLGGWSRLAVLLWGMGAISLAIYRRLAPTAITPASSSPLTPPLPPNTTVGMPQPA